MRRCEVQRRIRRRAHITFGLKQESIGRQSRRSKDLFTSYFSKAVQFYSTFAAVFAVYSSSLSSAKGWISLSRPISTMRGIYWGIIEVHNRRCQGAGTWRGRGINRRSCLPKESGHVGVPIMEMSTSSHPERDVSSQQTGPEPLWLGLDLSTQSLTAAILKGCGKGGAFNEPLVLESVNFEKDLPPEQRYGSKNGMTVRGSEVTSPVAMWLHALEALLQRLRDPKGALAAAGFDFSAVRAVSVSGQQHGTVYWAKGAGEKLHAMANIGTIEEDRVDGSSPDGTCSDERSLSGDKRNNAIVTAPRKAATGSTLGVASDETIAEAFSGCFAVKHTPIWADGSTEEYAAELEEKMGGADRLAKLTGSRAHLRQGGPQIMKIHRQKPEAYENTERISLVCSFLASVLVGRYAEIETSDGSGMNLMHIREKRWVDEALEATAPGLRARLGGDKAIVDSHEGVGNVSGYMCQRFGFSRNCLVVAGSGDNCNSLAGMGVVTAATIGDGNSRRGGDIMVSLGTSDTLLGVTTDPSPTTTGNTMYHPCDPRAWFAMLVYKNGSLTREGVRDRQAGGSWDSFSGLLDRGDPGNGGRLGLFLDLFEITPQINRQGSFFVDGEDEPITQGDLSPEEEVRAVVEGRFLSMKAHARELGVGQPSRILATGGGSKNPQMLQVLADVFQAPVFTAAGSDSAAVGAALRAKHGMECRTRGVPYVPFREIYGENDGVGEPAATPRPETAEAYDFLVDRMDSLERSVIEGRVGPLKEGWLF